jgi:putative transposase
MYLTAIIDWYSRYVISWELSNTLETDFCSRALKRALNKNKPLIFNTDQGSQFTSNDFTSILANHDISISMDGKGRSLDNIFIERLWRTLKYENIYRHSYETVQELMESLRIYFNYYNRFKALDSDSSRIIIEQTFYEFLDFCDKHSIEYRILSLASKNRLELIKGINPKRILGLEYSKANSKTYTSILKSFSKNKIEWFQLDDSPLALRSGRRAGLKTIMMLNDVFTIKDYQLNKEFIDFKTVSFNHIKKLIS